MESTPQVPEKSHSKNISVTSTVSKESEVRSPSRSGGQRAVKFGNGTNAGVELVPQPSESPLDPLNWPQWRKELAFGSLVLGSACIGILKTIFVTVNGVIATELSCSYMAATALTGVPLILGAFAGLGSTVLAQSIGKRGIYIGSSLLLLIGAVWNMHVYQSYAQFMVSRIFQGLSWGAFESLVLISVKDMFFVHERSRRVMMYNISNIIFTWGTPILGGYLSQNNESFRNQIMATNIIQTVSILLLILATPETSFSRSSVQSNPSTFESTTITTVSTPSAGKFKAYLSTLRVVTPHSTSKFQLSRALLPLRALSAPSTILTFLLTAPLVATSFATANTVSLLFGSMPTFLFPARIGYLFIAPLAMSLVLFSLASLAAFLRSRPPHHLTASKQLAAAIPGLVIGVAGSLSFGMYTYETLMPTTLDKNSVFTLYVQGQDLSLKVVSALFGLMVSGAVVVNFAGVMHIKYATTANREESDAVEGAHRTLQDILTGLFIVGLPYWLEGTKGMLMGLKDTVIALGVVQIVLGSSVGAMMWAKSEAIQQLDGRVLQRRENSSEREEALARVKRVDSFFEA